MAVIHCQSNSLQAVADCKNQWLDALRLVPPNETAMTTAAAVSRRRRRAALLWMYNAHRSSGIARLFVTIYQTQEARERVGRQGR